MFVVVIIVSSVFLMVELFLMCIMERRETSFHSVQKKAQQLLWSLTPEKHGKSTTLLIEEVDVILPSHTLSYQ